MIWWSLHQLKSSDPDIRVNAARSLGSAKKRKAIPALIRCLQDEDSEVRLAVIEALGAIGHPASADPLVATLSSPSTGRKNSLAAEREAVAKALVSIGAPAVSAVVEALDMEETEARRWAAVILGRLRDPRAVEPLIRKLDDSRSEVRKAAALALGGTGDLRALDALLKGLANRDFETRRSAAEALGLLRSETAADALIRAVSDSNEAVQIAAINALGRIGGWAAASCLRSAASGARKAVAEAAAAALKSMSFAPTTAEERAEVAVLRGEFETASREGTAAVPALMRALEFKDPRVRAEAARALGSLRSPEAVRPLLDCLKDHNTMVQIASANALASIGEPAREGLQGILSFYDASAVKLAAVALGEIGSAQSLQALLELVAGNAEISGEYPDLFDAVCAAATAIDKILSALSGKITRQNLAHMPDLPETIRLLGASPKTLDLCGLRAILKAPLQ